jgi:hypothetical protein
MQLRASYSLVRRSSCSRHFLRLCQFCLQARAQRLRPWLLRWICSKQLIPHVLNVPPLGKRFEIRFEQQAMHKCSLSIGAAMNRSPPIGQESALGEGLEILPTRRKANTCLVGPVGLSRFGVHAQPHNSFITAQQTILVFASYACDEGQCVC